MPVAVRCTITPAIQQVGLAANQVEFRQTVERAGDRQLKHRAGGEAASRASVSK